ncbi:MAG TPA: hypothetical protein VFG08_01840, partial [Candidatus Polarisedimenticolia bacterium]|nr:hypothetical protein [Candidatus Polarisedimenticolia bacterium]
GITPAPGCPEPDRILAAALGERPVEENRALASHAALCPSCAIAWRLARDYAVEFGMSLGERRPPARAGSGRGALAAAAAAILVITALLTWSRQEPPPAPAFRSGPGDTIESLVPEGGALPASSFVLRWSAGPPGCRYNVRVTDRSLNLLAGARALGQPEYTVPPASLAGVEPGSLILWQVEAIRQDDSRISSLTFSARLE